MYDRLYKFVGGAKTRILIYILYITTYIIITKLIPFIPSFTELQLPNYPIIIF